MESGRESGGDEPGEGKWRDRGESWGREVESESGKVEEETGRKTQKSEAGQSRGGGGSDKDTIGICKTQRP